MKTVFFIFVLTLTATITNSQNRVCTCVQPSIYDPVVYPEYPGAAVTNTTEISVPSSRDAGVTMKIAVTYPTSGTNLPMLVFVAGYHAPYTSLDNLPLYDNSTRYAQLGYFLLKVDHRGSGNATGTWDDRGREAYDVYDAIKYVQANYSSKLAANKISYFGYSSGGGMALILGSRFPDLFQSITDYFGISNWKDWYEQEPTRHTTLSTAIGGDPTTKPNEYNARWSKSAIAQNHIGFLSMFHDADDDAVQVDHSQQVAAAYIAVGRTSDYYYSESNSGSAKRWTHAYPQGSVNDLEYSEQFWLTGSNQRAKMYVPRLIPKQGTLNIIGSVYTKRFSIILHDGTVGNGDRSRTATAVYDVTANTYQITNTSSLSLTAIITTTGGATVTQSINSGETVILSPI